MSKQCKCGKGHISLWDNKCGKCRTKKEQYDLQYALENMEIVSNNTEMSPKEAYDYLRKLYK